MRDIDCYLTEEEKKAITDYIFKGERAKYINELTLKKYIELNHQLNTRFQNTAPTYWTYIEQNEILCPIDAFLTTLSSTFEDEKFRILEHGRRGLLGILEKGIDDCVVSCPCPAECH